MLIMFCNNARFNTGSVISLNLFHWQFHNFDSIHIVNNLWTEFPILGELSMEWARVCIMISSHISEVNFCPPSTSEFRVNFGFSATEKLKAGRAGFTYEIRKKKKRKRKMTYWEKLKKSCHLLQLHSQQFGMIRNWKVDVFRFLSKCQTLVNFSGPWKVNR